MTEFVFSNVESEMEVYGYDSVSKAIAACVMAVAAFWFIPKMAGSQEPQGIRPAPSIMEPFAVKASPRPNWPTTPIA